MAQGTPMQIVFVKEKPENLTEEEPPQIRRHVPSEKIYSKKRSVSNQDVLI